MAGYKLIGYFGYTLFLFGAALLLRAPEKCKQTTRFTGFTDSEGVSARDISQGFLACCASTHYDMGTERPLSFTGAISHIAYLQCWYQKGWGETKERGTHLTFVKASRLAWAAPCSLLGVVAAAVILLLGGKAVISAGVLEVTYREHLRSCGKLAAQLQIRGIVFGNIILAVTQEELLQIGPHERVHVEQYERWGMFFFLAYGLSNLWQLMQGRSPYWHNHFEVQARHVAAQRFRIRS